MLETRRILSQKIHIGRIKHFDVELSMARADTLCDLASGNKIYKLSPVIEYIKENKIKQILSFGGAFSNHIHALALLAQENNIESIALIRGEESYATNPTLTDARNAGMKLEFVDRTEYKLRNDKAYLAKLQKRYPDALIVAEGGSSQLAIKGCAQMARDINAGRSVIARNFNKTTNDFLAVASGTGASAAGLVCGLANNQQLKVYSVLKDASLASRIDQFIRVERDRIDEGNNKNKVKNKNKTKASQYSLINADFGGYAKLDKHHIDFIISFLDETGILLDPIYTSKMCRRLIQQIEAGEFPKGSKITMIHTGGLQGWRGMQSRVEKLAGNDAWLKIKASL